MRRGFPGLLCLVFLVLLAACSYVAVPQDLPEGVTVTDWTEYLLVESNAGQPEQSVMFYPGALVEPSAYVPVLAPLAAKGYRVCVVRFPADLAVLDAGKGIRLARQLGGSWVIGGHSLGGVMAANAVRTEPALFRGLFFLASWPASGDSLADWPGRVLSLSASNDGLSTPAEIQANKVLQPPEAAVDTPQAVWPAGSGWTVYHQIAGGNHAQFGSYGAQDGDGVATITAREQWAEIQDWLEPFLALVY